MICSYGLILSEHQSNFGIFINKETVEKHEFSHGNCCFDLIKQTEAVCEWISCWKCQMSVGVYVYVCVRDAMLVFGRECRAKKFFSLRHIVSLGLRSFWFDASRYVHRKRVSWRRIFSNNFYLILFVESNTDMFNIFDIEDFFGVFAIANTLLNKWNYSIFKDYRPKHAFSWLLGPEELLGFCFTKIEHRERACDEIVNILFKCWTWCFIHQQNIEIVQWRIDPIKSNWICYSLWIFLHIRLNGLTTVLI